MGDVPSFAEFVAAVDREAHGPTSNRHPFPWQQRLAVQVASKGWPAGIRVPTGLGKTAVLSLAVYELARRRAAGDRAPHRVFFGIDRRVVVDAAFADAQDIQRALRSGSDPVLRWAAESLRPAGGDEALEVVRMRGGATWSSQWLTRPDQPAIIVGTVDQLGSRLLFRGYGVGNGRRPIDAALVGTDSLVFIDEAHMSQPFFETVRSVVDRQARAVGLSDDDMPTIRGPQLVSMSATLPPGLVSGQEVFVGGDERDLKDPVAAPRLEAQKWVVPVELGYLTGAKFAAKQYEQLAGALATAARTMVQGKSTALVVVNTVGLARQVFELLHSEPDLEAELLIGRTRPFDREHRTGVWMPRIRAGRSVDDGDPTPFVLVATQTVEVGADLDADVLITEACPLDSLAQRLGRVDRRGRLGSTRTVVISGPARREHDFVYGAATTHMWEWLVAGAVDPVTVERASRLRSLLEGVATSDDELGLDLGALALPKHLDAVSEGDPRLPEPPITPVLLDSIVRRWTWTRPAPVPDEEPAPYLHGIGRSEPTVQVVWRADLPNGTEAARQVLTAIPPSTQEAIELSLRDARRLLRAAATRGGEPDDSYEDDQADLEAVVHPRDEDDFVRAPAGVRAFSYRGGDAIEEVRYPSQLRPGGTLVVASEIGGCDEYGFSVEAKATVADLGDVVRARPQLRLDIDVLRSLGFTNPDGEPPLGEVLGRFRRDVGELEAQGAEVTEPVQELLGSLRSCIPTGRVRGALLATIIDALLAVDVWQFSASRSARRQGLVQVLELNESADQVDGADGGGRPRLVLVAPPTGDGAVDAGSFEDADEDQDDSSRNGREDVSLHAHLRDVGGRAHDLAEALGLPDSLVTALRLAGEIHDAGKADLRFQAMLRHGDRIAAEAWANEPAKMLAKSRMDQRDRGSWRRAKRAAEMPSGLRHEAISAAMIDELSAEAFPEAVDIDLVRHLVGTHHGWGRPFFPPIIDREMAKARFRILDRDVVVSSEAAHRDASQPARMDRLQERYGPWGLALLETVLRLADISISVEGK